MKTLRRIGMALLAVVLCVNLASCSDDDDEEGKVNGSIEGTWYLSHEIWYETKAHRVPDLSKVSYEESYPYHSDERIWVITKDEKGTYWLNENPTGKEDDFLYILIPDGKNSFKQGDSEWGDRITIKEVTDKKLVVIYEDHYYDQVYPEDYEYGIYTFDK